LQIIKIETHINMAETTEVTASHGIKFTVRLIEKGDCYGLNMRITHDKVWHPTGKVEPMIEFYDTRFEHAYDFIGTVEEAIAAGAPCLGQFVSRYYAFTLLNGNIDGLQMDGRVADWRIDADALRAALSELGVYKQIKVVVTYDSRDPDVLPRVWLPPHEAKRCEVVLLDKGQELGGREPATDPARASLLEASRNSEFPNYVCAN
jgi:hypothetical protein